MKTEQLYEKGIDTQKLLEGICKTLKDNINVELEYEICPTTIDTREGAISSEEFVGIDISFNKRRIHECFRTTIYHTKWNYLDYILHLLMKISAEYGIKIPDSVMLDIFALLNIDNNCSYVKVRNSASLFKNLDYLFALPINSDFELSPGETQYQKGPNGEDILKSFVLEHFKTNYSSVYTDSTTSLYYLFKMFTNIAYTFGTTIEFLHLNSFERFLED